MLGWVLLAIIVCARCDFDFYLVRHGARAPLEAGSGNGLLDVFGVRSQQLTMPGKSEAYYFGKDLRLRHQQLRDDDLWVYSTPTARTRMSAEYFFKGWNYQHPKPLSTADKIVEFVASPKYTPPTALSYTPKVVSEKINENAYAHLVKSIPEEARLIRLVPANQLRRMSDPALKYDPTSEVAGLSNQQGNSICEKVALTFPGYCKPGLQAESNMFAVADLANCLSYLNRTIPDLSDSELNLTRKFMDLDYANRVGSRVYRDPAIANLFTRIIKDNVSGTTKLVVEFNHDVFIFMVVRVLIGWEAFSSMFQPHLTMPFLSSLHFSLRNDRVQIIYNDKPLQLAGCNPCTFEAFTRYLSRLP